MGKKFRNVSFHRQTIITFTITIMTTIITMIISIILMATMWRIAL